jgi:CDP-glucose 4,6-dehydratase
MTLEDFANEWRKKGPILLTGHTGFKGTWLTLLLLDLGIQVVGYSLEALPDSMYSRLALKGLIPEVVADIRDKNALSRVFDEHQPSAVIHLAAQPLVMESYLNPHETFETNVMGTVNLLQGVEKSNTIEVVLIATTDKVYRNDNSGKSFIETDPLGAVDPYSASKVATEAAVAAWQNITSDRLRLISVRAGNVIGGGDFSKNRLIPDCIRAHQTNTVLKLRNPSSTRPWQHVLEPLSGYLIALGFGTDSAYNLGPKEGSSMDVEQVVQALRKQMPFDYEIEVSKTNHYESTTLSLDSSLAKRKLGWEPQFSQEMAISITGDWWKAAMRGDDLVAFTRSQIEEFILLNAPI